MNDDFLKNINLNDIQMARPDYESMIRNPFTPEMKKALDDGYKRRAEAEQAQIDAAEDIAEMKGQMTDVIENQRVQIENQKAQIERQEKTIEQLQNLNETQKQQLRRLKEIFYSIEDGTAVNKEVMKELEKILEQQPGWGDFIKDKGADAVVGGVLAALPQLLMKFGIML